ncbi:hypothetical protein HanPSC8_Chr01g0006091 [Helianthus annuus]|nr:hypothetical protein HanPSC8_Chr01g0006091 [Helianthus annuus]
MTRFPTVSTETALILWLVGFFAGGWLGAAWFAWAVTAKFWEALRFLDPLEEPESFPFLF